MVKFRVKHVSSGGFDVMIECLQVRVNGVRIFDQCRVYKCSSETTTNRPIELNTPNPGMAAKPVLAYDLITKDSIGLFQERARRRLQAGTRQRASVDDVLSGGLIYGQHIKHRTFGGFH